MYELSYGKMACKWKKSSPPCSFKVEQIEMNVYFFPCKINADFSKFKVYRKGPYNPPPKKSPSLTPLCMFFQILFLYMGKKWDQIIHTVLPLGFHLTTYIGHLSTNICLST